jgi:hypothetical protein
MDSSFWQTWGDGQAELTSYRLQFPRYGAARPGTAVAIFVTENFSRKSRVKTDATPEASPDAFPVMKLNLVEDFQTGIYDYNVMTSTFVALRPVEGRAEGYPTKVSFGSQEWCGHVYQQLLFGQHAVSSSMHSYFEGEADLRAELPSPRNGVVEDALLHWARGMAQPMLKPGETRSVPFLPSLKSAQGGEVAILRWRSGRNGEIHPRPLLADERSAERGPACRPGPGAAANSISHHAAGRSHRSARASGSPSRSRGSRRSSWPSSQ